MGKREGGLQMSEIEENFKGERKLRIFEGGQSQK